MPDRLLERERELDQIAISLDEAAAGRGSAVVLEGPAGIGKTSLLESGRDTARARRFAVAGARGSELETAYAWGIVRQLLEPRLRGMPSAARTRALEGAAALAGPVVLPDAGTPETDAEGSFGVLHGLYWLVAGLAAERPQLLIVDDLHWADRASVRFLEFLANRLDALPLLLLAARRPVSATTDGASLAAPLELSPLSPAAAEAVLAERYGAPLPAAFAAACHGATGGNPLLLRRLAEGLHYRGVDDAAAVVRLGSYAVAGTVGASLARLGSGPTRLARAVAVLEEPPLILAAGVAGVEEFRAAGYAEQLVRAGILRDARPLAFQHALVRDAVLSGLTAGERAELHEGAARILRRSGAAVEAVALHLLHTEPRGDGAVARTLVEAGRRALASGAPEEAVAALGRALAEPPPARRRAPLLLDLARAEHALGRPEALRHVLDAHAAAVDEPSRAQAALALGWATGPGRQDPEEALAMVEQAIAGVAGRHSELELKLQAVRFAVLFMSDTLLEPALGQPERFAHLEGRTQGECELLPHVAIHRFLCGRSAADVAEPLERAVSNAELVGAIGPDSAWLLFVLSQLFKTDRLDLARRTVEVALAEALRRGSAPGFAMASVWRAWISLREGAGDVAEADARAAYEALPAGMWQRVFCSACLVEVLIERRELEEAQVVLAAAGGDESLLYVRSLLREAQGDPRGALAAQLESRPQGSGFGVDPDFDGWLRIARGQHALGEGDAAAQEVAGALRWARTWGTPGYVGQALTVSGLIVGGEAGLAQLREAVGQLERSPARRELARSLVELGAALRRRGARVAAREPLRRALDLASAGGLTATAERAREELRITGAKVRRAESSGVGSLTPSERRIVDLAAGGASNPEIAQALFVTVKTVEMHLGNAYRKLGVSSRRELAPLIPAG